MNAAKNKSRHRHEQPLTTEGRRFRLRQFVRYRGFDVEGFVGHVRRPEAAPDTTMCAGSETRFLGTRSITPGSRKQLPSDRWTTP
jgi:hypothetical protein